MKHELTVREELLIWMSIKALIREERKWLRSAGVKHPGIGYIVIERLTKLRHIKDKF